MCACARAWQGDPPPYAPRAHAHNNTTHPARARTRTKQADYPPTTPFADGGLGTVELHGDGVVIKRAKLHVSGAGIGMDLLPLALTDVPHIVPVLGPVYGADGLLAGVAMPHAPHGSLADVLVKRRGWCGPASF